MVFYDAVGKLGRKVTAYAVNRATDYAYNSAKRKISGFFTPTPKRGRRTPVSQRTHITNTPSSMRFSPRRAGRTVAMTNLRRRLQRTPIAIRRRRRPGLYGATSSKSSGFIGRGKRVRFRGLKQKSNNLGTVQVIEKGGVLDAGQSSAIAGNTVAVGHCNMPPELAHRVFWRAMIKKLLVNMKMDVTNFELAIAKCYTGDVVRIYYKTHADSSNTEIDYALAGPAGGLTTDTPELVTGWFHNAFLNGSINFQDVEFYAIEYRPTMVTGRILMTAVNVDLRNAYFVFFGKSTLKVQNRSVTSGNTDEDAVDNVPLYGKTYGGKGSGTSGITNDAVFLTAAYGFWCDSSTGTMAKVPTEKWYQEVVQPNHFKQVTYSGKIHLDPGHIKTSVLDGKIKVSLNKVYKILFNQPNASARSHEKAMVGSFRFMLLEKMINSVSGLADNGIKMAYEHNIRVGGYIVTKRSYTTAQLNSVANITSES